MTPPEYDWICLRCNQKNAAAQNTCKTCDLPAKFTARQLAEYKPKDLPTDNTYDDTIFRLLITFVPEAPIALFCLVATPEWVRRLFASGHFGAGFGLIIATAFALIGVWFAVVRKQKWIAYVAILGYLLCVGLAA